MGSYTRQGYCLKCRSRCGVVAQVDDGRLVAVRADEAHPNGGICAMGRAETEVTQSPRRLTRPLRRTSPKDAPPAWEEIGWDEALDEVAARLRAVERAHGPEAVAFSRPTTSANASADWAPYLLRLAARFGTPNAHSTSYLCQWNRDNGLKRTIGTGLPTPDLERTALFLLFGHNAAVTNQNLMDRVRRARGGGARVVVIDPRRTEASRFADQWLAPEYGTDGALVLGAIRHLLVTGTYDATFTRSWTTAPFLIDAASGRLVREGDTDRLVVRDVAGRRHPVDPSTLADQWSVSAVLHRALDPDGAVCAVPVDALEVDGEQTVFEALCARVAECTPAWVAERTGLSPEDIAAFNEALATARPVSYFTWNGWEQHDNSFLTHRAMATLYALTGCLQDIGGNLSIPSLELPGLAGGGMLPRAQAAKRLGRDEHPVGVPTSNALTFSYWTSILEGVPYRLRALVSFGSNMLLQAPDVERGRAAMRALDFHAHVDLFHTPMADAADLLLPAAAMWESPGLKLGFDGGSATTGHVQFRAPVVEPPGDALPDIEIIFALARRLGFGDDFWGGDVRASFEARLAPLGLDLAALEAAPGGLPVASEPRPRGYAELDADTGRPQGFATPTGKVELYLEALLDHGHEPLVAYRPPRSNPAVSTGTPEGFPLVLSSRKLPVIAQSQHRGIPSLRRRWPAPFVEVHPDTAEAHGFADGDEVRVETPLAAMTVRLKVSDRVRSGTVVGQAGWWEDCPPLELPGADPYSDDGANFNRLVDPAWRDPLTGGMPVKSYFCRLRPISAPSSRTS